MVSRIERYEELVDAMHLTARSRRGYVTVTRDRSGEVAVRLGRGMLAGLSEREVAEEIESALVNGLAEYNSALADIRRQVFGSSLGLPERREAT